MRRAESQSQSLPRQSKYETKFAFINKAIEFNAETELHASEREKNDQISNNNRFRSRLFSLCALSLEANHTNNHLIFFKYLQLKNKTLPRITFREKPY